MPKDYLKRIAARFDTTARNGSEASVLRDIAGCMRDFLHSEVPPQVSASLITMTYVCDNRFRVRNGNADWVDVAYGVYQTDDKGDLAVPPNGEITFTTDSTGTTRLSLSGKVIQSKANLRTACP